MTTIDTEDDDDGSSTTMTSFLEANKHIGIVIGLSAASIYSIVVVLSKKLSNLKTHYSVTSIYGAMFGLPPSFLVTALIYLSGMENKDHSLIDTHAKASVQAACALGAAVSGVVGQVLMVSSLRYEEPSKVSIVQTCNLFFGFLLQYLLLNIVSNLFSMSGAICICLSTITLILVKYVERKHANCCISPII